jgi:hypothetical protein
MPTTKAFGLFQPVYSGAARFLGLNLQAPPRPSTLRRGPPLKGLAAVVFGRFGRITVAVAVDQITKPKLNKSPHQLEEELSILTRIEQARR